MNDELLTKILEALESIDRRLAILELRPNYPMYDIPSPGDLPWGPARPWEPLFTPSYTGDPLPTTTSDRTSGDSQRTIILRYSI